MTTPSAEPTAISKIDHYLSSETVKARFAEIVGERNSGAYISSVMLAVADSTALQKCQADSIYISALRAATLRLSVDPGLGQAYLVPFKGKAVLIVGYKGLQDMAVRTGKYRYINVGPVYEGEEVEEDRISGFHSLKGHKSSRDAKVIGWLAAFELYAGFAHTMYMTVEEIHQHAQEYSKGYDYKNDQGEYTSLWHKESIKMERKTVLRLLLRKWGYLDPSDAAVLKEIENEPESINSEFDEGEYAEPEPTPRRSEEQNLADLGFSPEPATTRPSFTITDDVDKIFPKTDAQPTSTKASPPVPIKGMKITPQDILDQGLTKSIQSASWMWNKLLLVGKPLDQGLEICKLYRRWRDAGLEAKDAAVKTLAKEEPPAEKE
jgi:recombination protein RecT